MKKIKALQLFDDYLPITENWAHRLLVNTHEVEISVFAKSYLFHNYYSPEFYFIPHLDNYLLQADKTLGKKTFSELALKAAIRLLRKISPGHNNSLYKHLKSNQYDVVHAHFANIGWDFLSAVRKSNTPYVLSFYGWDYEKLPFIRPEFKDRFQQLFQACAAIVCEGPYGASTLIKQGCPPEKIHVIHLGLEIDQIPFYQREKKTGELNLIQIAAFSETKGYLEAIEAFAMASVKCPNMRYTIIGLPRDAGYKEKMIELINRLGLENKVELLPKVDYATIHRRFKEFHVFIHPSQYTADMNCEGGAPIIILDAQATGMPVLATFHCDIPNEVGHEATGLLAEEKNVAGIAAQIERFYQMDQSEYHQMSVSARKKMETEFDVREGGRQLSRLYRTICPITS